MILHRIYVLRENNATKGTITLVALSPLELIKKARKRKVKGIMTDVRVTADKFNRLIKEGR